MTSSRITRLLVLCSLVCLIFAASIQAEDYSPEITTALEQKDTAQVLLLLDQAIKLDAGFAPNYLLKGKIFFARNQMDKALEMFDTALDKKSKLFEALYFKGLVLLKQKKVKEAEKIFKDGIKKAKEEKAMFHNGLGLLYIEQGKYSEADVEFRKANQEDPNNVEYIANLGDANYFSNIYALAINEYNKVIQLDTTYLDVYFRLARCYVKMGQYNDALDQLSIVLSRDTMYAHAWKEAGRLYTMAGLSARDPEMKKQRFSETIGSYRKFLALTNDSTDGEVFFNIGRAYFNLGGFAQADSAFTYVLGLGDKPSNIYLYAGRAKISIEQYQEGIDYLKQHLALMKEADPNWTPSMEDAELYRRLGDAYRAIEDHANAAENYVQAFNLIPNNSRLALMAAISYHQNKDYGPALEYYDKCIELSQDIQASIVMNAALCALNLEEYERAIVYLEKVVELEPTNDKAFALLSDTYISKLDNCQKGLEWTLKLYESDTTNCDALQTLGYIYFASEKCQTDYLKAVSYFKKALDCYKSKGQDNCGNSDLMRYVAQAYHLHAAALSDADKKDESKKYFKNAFDWYVKTLNCNPGDKEAEKGKNDTEFEY
ncbi:MAG: tetratricopeptide repeat protein [Candidatus Zixiibacteriota bacterium]